MIRPVALVLLFVLTGTPTTDALCAIRCAGVCDLASAARRATGTSVRADGGLCQVADALAPALTAGAPHELQAPAVSSHVVAVFRLALPLQRQVAARYTDTEPPPGHFAAPTILRI
jgi:hypothetical protein